MGSVLSDSGVQAGVSGVPPSSLSSVKTSRRPSKAGITSVRPRATPISRSDYGSTSRGARTRVLLKPLRCPEAKRRRQAYSGPKVIKPLFKSPVFSNGVHSFGGGRPPRKGVLGLHRYKGRIPARSDFPRPLQVSAFCPKLSALSVRGSSVRTSHGPSGFYEDPGPRISHPKGTGHSDHGLPRRSSGSRPLSGRSKSGSVASSKLPRVPGLGSKPGQIGFTAHKKVGVSRSDFRYKTTTDLPAPVQSGLDKGVNPHSPKQHKAIYTPLHAPVGKASGHLRGSALCPDPFSEATESNSRGLGQKTPGLGSSHLPSLCGKAEPVLVASHKKSSGRKIVQSPLMEDSNHGCQPIGLGCSPRRFNPTGEMVKGRISPTHKCLRDPSSSVGSFGLDGGSAGLPSKGTIRQCHCRSLYKPPGWHQESGSPKGGRSDLFMGRSPCPLHLSYLYPRGGQLASGLPQPPTDVPRGVVPSSRSVPGHLPEVGYSGGGHYGVQIQCQSSKLCLSNEGSIGLRDRCLGVSLASVCANLCLPSNTDATPSSSQNSKGTQASDSSGPSVAPKTLVLLDKKDDGRGALGPPSTSGPPLTRAILPPCLTGPKFNGLAAESLILRNRGLSGQVISTLISARKPVSRLIYYRVWKAYITWCETRKWDPRKYTIGRILEFLQLGVEKGLAVGTIKGQVSALSVFFQRPLAAHSLMKSFLQGVIRVNPPIKAPLYPWDLNLVLSALQRQPFEPLSVIPLVLLTRKLVFLVAMASARRVSELAALSCKAPYLLLHKDRVVLRPLPSFLPKVVSNFHLNQDVILPSFFPKPSSKEERLLHSLDVVRAVKIYLEATAQIRKTDVLFILPEGPKKGQAASKATIAKWIRQTIIQAYGLKGKSPPLSVKAHSTRAISASWAAYHQVPMAQVCRAATWSSVHTFAKFYQMDVRRNADSAFGQAVLQAAV